MKDLLNITIKQVNKSKARVEGTLHGPVPIRTMAYYLLMIEQWCQETREELKNPRSQDPEEAPSPLTGQHKSDNPP